MVRWCIIFAIVIVAVCGLNVVRWQRCEYYDQKSPDGQYAVRVYGDMLHISFAVGGGGDRKAKFELVENATGKVIGSGALQIMWMVQDTFWHEDSVDVTVGDGGLHFQLPHKIDSKFL